MNEVLIKELVKLKLGVAEEILSSLPPKASDDLRNLGRLVLEGLNEGSCETRKKPDRKSQGDRKLDNIPIE